MMIDAPILHARYRAKDGSVRDGRHYEDDKPEFTGYDGRVWRRTAVTTQRYRTPDAAAAELVRIESEAAQ